MFYDAKKTAIGMTIVVVAVALFSFISGVSLDLDMYWEPGFARRLKYIELAFNIAISFILPLFFNWLAVIFKEDTHSLFNIARFFYIIAAFRIVWSTISPLIGM